MKWVLTNNASTNDIRHKDTVTPGVTRTCSFCFCQYNMLSSSDCGVIFYIGLDNLIGIQRCFYISFFRLINVIVRKHQ